jgi:predicted flap endonuclease-1-like 5' DNA nuclease
MSETLDHLAATPRRTLAMRLAERNGQRALRAARLARLRASDEPLAAAGQAPRAGAAIEAYLPAASAAAEAATAPGPLALPEAAPPAVPLAPGELARLAGVGPGLAALLRRAGLVRLADIAPLEPAALAARLGPAGRLVPAARWIAAARGEAAEPLP